MVVRSQMKKNYGMVKKLDLAVLPGDTIDLNRNSKADNINYYMLSSKALFVKGYDE